MRADPEPDNGIALFKQSDDTIRASDTNRYDRLRAMNTFKVEARMTGIR